MHKKTINYSEQPPCRQKIFKNISQPEFSIVDKGGLLVYDNISEINCEKPFVQEVKL
jgi:hypothetical protein